ncbi:MAG: histone deacetylase [Chloroflexi bacterium]|nr:histone deacetylase [Chloroflexota bacterium]
MQSLYCLAAAHQHQFPDHPEQPKRLELLEIDTIPGIAPLPFSAATREEIGRVHNSGMLTKLEDDCLQGPGIIDSAPTYVTRNSFEAARLAAGASLAVTRAVIKGTARNAFAIVRPPGHHAEPDQPMGFCLLNNAAIAALDAIQNGIERVLVVDYDAHHGNGTEKALLNNPRAGYFSTHQEGIYPGSGWLEAAPRAKGRIANFPLPAYSGDTCFDQLFEHALTPFLKTYSPGLIIVSAGFDAHWTDPITSLGLSTAGYYSISKKLIDLANEVCAGKIVFVLEGGYDPENVSNCVRAVFSAMTGNEPPQVNDLSRYPEPDIRRRVDAFRKWHGL